MKILSFIVTPESAKFAAVINSLSHIDHVSPLRSILVLTVISLLVSHHNPVWGQQEPRLGISVRPVIPSGLFDNTSLEISQGGVDFLIQPKAAYALGVTLRQDLPYFLSLETGIHYARRTYHLTITDSDFTTRNNFRFVTYEIPINGLIYIRLTENTYLNNAFGLSLDFVPNNIYTENEYYKQRAERTFWVLPALSAETGWEYRTEKRGIFYAGGAYHRMLVRLADTRITYLRDAVQADITTRLSGHYFAFNLRYFFPTQRTAPIDWD